MLFGNCSALRFNINLSTKWKKCIFKFSLLLGGLLLIVNELTKPTFFEFEEMPKILMPTRKEDSLLDANTSYCDHVYERNRTTKTIEIFNNISDVQLSNFAMSSNVRKGGFWSPEYCLPKYQVNIVIPYRGRPQHLRTFLHYIHRFLPNQLIGYRIFVVEQTEDKPFNRGKLFNVGFIEAQKQHPADCYIFHDVDLLPQSLNNMYACSEMPRHLSSAIDNLNFQLPYRTNFGGAIAMTSSCYEKINGHSNLFYGWGAEDDDLYYRTRAVNLNVIRFETAVSIYKALEHVPEEKNPERHRMLKLSKEIQEGLNSIEYDLLAQESFPLYTWFLVRC